MSTIYTGRWTDWSKGSWKGDQITLPNSSGNVLIAFIAIFVSFVGSLAWSMIAYLIHLTYASRKPQDGLYHQIMLLLADGSAPSLFAWKMLRLFSAWRKSPIKRVFVRTIGLALLSILIYGAFIIAGILLSLVAGSGFVLYHPDHIGWPVLPTNVSAQAQLDWELALNAWADEAIEGSYNYGQLCYETGQGYRGSVSQGSLAPAANCDYFAKSSLSWTTTHPEKCPFADSSVCRGPKSDIVEFDTGLLSTLDDIGINTRREDSLLFRRRTTCAPLETEGFSTGGFVNNTRYGPIAIYNYGQSTQKPLTPWNDTRTFFYTHSMYEAGNLPYQMQYVSSDDMVVVGDEITPQFMPDPRLGSQNTSITLLFLANRAIYDAPVNDPWFNATTPLSADSDLMNLDDTGPFYYSEIPGSVLGCVTDYQICNSSESCVDWDANNIVVALWGSGDDSLNPLNLNERQKQLANHIAGKFYNSAFWTIVSTMGSESLVAWDYLNDLGSPLSLTIPPTQWIAEVQRLQAASTAMLQRAFLMSAAGPSDPILSTQLEPPKPEEVWFFYSHKVRSNAYVSFSVLGLGLIFGVGGLLILSTVLMLLIIPRIQKWIGYPNGWRKNQWLAQKTFHLQRTVFEDRGLGSWKGELGDVPVTETAERFEPFIASGHLKSLCMDESLADHVSHREKEADILELEMLTREARNDRFTDDAQTETATTKNKLLPSDSSSVASCFIF